MINFTEFTCHDFSWTDLPEVKNNYFTTAPTNGEYTPGTMFIIAA